MSPSLVPGLDPAGITGPAWLFHVLLVLTFVLHMLFMNLAVGGTLLAAVAHVAGKRNEHMSLLANRLAGINSFGISLAITTGVAPLLFIQVLYQQYFYSATILVGGFWFAFLILLLVGYYALYLYKMRQDPKTGRGHGGWIWLSATTLTLISMVHVAVHLVHVQPGLWDRLADAPWLILADRTYIVRLLHFLLAAIGFSAIICCWWAVRQARAGHDQAINSRIAATAWQWTLWTTVAQVVDGFALLLLLPQEVLIGFMRQGPGSTIPFTVAVLLGIGLVVMLSRVSDPITKPALVSGVLATFLATIAIMSVTRHQVRIAYLDIAVSRQQLVEVSQWGNVVLFMALLAAGATVTTFMVRRVLTNQTTGDDAA